MSKTFASPQTGSVYTVVNSEDNIFVSYRSIGNGLYRVRIQGPQEALEEVRQHLTYDWGGVKEGDHLSCVVKGEKLLSNAVGDAVRAVTLALCKACAEEANKEE